MNAPSEAPKLLPCPFCGGEAEINNYAGSGFEPCCGNPECFVDCGVTWTSPECAVKEWNRRAPTEHEAEIVRLTQKIADAATVKATLIADVEEARAVNFKRFQVIFEQERQIATLQASNEAMRKDAERYKFIRENSYVEIHCDSPRVTNWEGALDNSVDAAIHNQSELGK